MYLALDPLLVGEARPGAHRLDDVEELAGHELGAHPVEHRSTTAQVGLGQAAGGVHGIGPGEAQVARQDGPREPEPRAVARPAPLGVGAGQRAVRGRHPAAGVRVVHDVVVDEGGGLEQLHRAREPDQCVGVGATGRTVSPVEERGAQPLPAPQQVGDHPQQVVDVGPQLGENHRLASQLVVEAALHPAPQVDAVERAGHGGPPGETPWAAVG